MTQGAISFEFKNKITVSNIFIPRYLTFLCYLSKLQSSKNQEILSNLAVFCNHLAQLQETIYVLKECPLQVPVQRFHFFLNILQNYYFYVLLLIVSHIVPLLPIFKSNKFQSTPIFLIYSFFNGSSPFRCNIKRQQYRCNVDPFNHVVVAHLKISLFVF